MVIPSGSAEAMLDIPAPTGGEAVSGDTLRIELVDENQPFSLVILPDTQYYIASAYGGNPDMFAKQIEWITNNQVGENIAFVLHEGDCTDQNTLPEWARFKSSMSRLDGVVPYAIAVGNHDGGVGTVPDTSYFNRLYPVADFERTSTFGGVCETNKMDNTYHLFRAGGVDWLVLSLEFGPDDKVLGWAARVIQANPDRKVIYLSHAHVYYDDTLHGSSNGHEWAPRAYARFNSGQQVWDKMLRRFPNVAFAFNGHVLNDGLGRVEGVGNFGNRVIQMLCNYQTRPGGGGGFMRVIRFFPGEDRFEARSFSPYSGQTYSDDQNQFQYDHLGVFSERSGGYTVASNASVAIIQIPLAGVEPPAAVSAEAHGWPQTIRIRFDRPLMIKDLPPVGGFLVDGVPVKAAAPVSGDDRCLSLTPAEPLALFGRHSLTMRGLTGQGWPVLPGREADTIEFEASDLLMRSSGSIELEPDWAPVGTVGVTVPEGDWDGFVDGDSQLGRAPDAWVWDSLDAHDWKDCRIEIHATSVTNEVGVILGVVAGGVFEVLAIDPANRAVRIERSSNQMVQVIAEQAIESVRGGPIDIDMVRSEGSVSVSINGVTFFGRDVESTEPVFGTVGFTTVGGYGKWFDSFQVRMKPSGPAPEIEMVIEADRVRVATGEDAILTVRQTAGDSGMVRVDYSMGDEPDVSRFESPFRLIWRASDLGVFQFNASAMDIFGRRCSASTVIRVEPKRDSYDLDGPLRLWLGGKDAGAVQIGGKGLDHRAHRLEVSEDLVHWRLIDIVTELNMELTLATESPSGTGKRFYRLVEEVP